MNAVTETVAVEAVSGVEIFVPLAKLKKSPRNARKVPHGETAIEALAASIQHKGLIQNLVIEPEVKEDGTPTGNYLVTAGEGRRLAMLLRAKRKQIKKSEPVRCWLDTQNDPAEVSLDENVTRTPMHPADQFERFHELSRDKGWGAEEIGARFGVSAHVVKQRLRLGAVSPKLLEVYRQDGLTLDQLMAFGISEDHARQEQVFEALHHNREPWIIRRDMTAANVPAQDRRAIFVGTEAYQEAGGTIKRAFMAQASNQRTVSVERLTTPASPNVVQAGSVVPAALITGIRSDLPGQITAQVTANVYDSPTGRFLLIPQGARLIGEYDSEVAAGQTRVLLAWDRLIMPDGRSIVLERQPGADGAGLAGLQDRVNQHWGNLLKAAAISTLLGVGAELGADSDDDLTRALQRGSQDTISQTGQQIVRRQLNVRPTLTIRPGHPLRVILTRDLVLEPIGGNR